MSSTLVLLTGPKSDVTPYLADSIESVFNGTGNFGGVSSDSSLNGNYDGFCYVSRGHQQR